MKRVVVAVMWFFLAGWAVGQQYPPEDFPAQVPTKQQKTTKPPSTDDTPPHSLDETGESSSKDTKLDLSPPTGDAKEHPNSGVADEVLELRPYDPHKAQKAIEIGDFYFRRDNYKAALGRYQEALQWKPNDAVATFKLAECFAKLGRVQEARANYEAYLKLLPDGPHAKEARKALSKLPPAVADSAQKPQAANSAPTAGPSKN
jgi:tetratricopeptide (TPR) repeat protein